MDGDLIIHCGQHSGDIFAEVAMVVEGEAGDGGLGHGQDVAIVLSLARDKIESILAAGELCVRILLPVVKVLLGEGAKFSLDGLPGGRSFNHLLLSGLCNI